jgi:glycosyltransferase involved in cell wall biosynthesis
MKIAVIGSKGLPAKQGGIERHCAEIYSRIAAQGHTVDLFARSSYTGYPWMSEHYVEGVRVISLPSVSMRGLDAFFSSALGALLALGKGYDIVHFHALGPSLFTWISKLASSAKVVATCQGLDWQRAKWGKLSSKLIQMGEQAAVRYADEIVVVSEDLRAYFDLTYGKATVYIPNGPSSFASSDARSPYLTSMDLQKGQYILFLGRLVPEKCPDLLIKAFQSFNSLGWKLVIAGGVSDTESFATQLHEMAENNSDVVFTGELKGERLAEVVRGAGLFVLPSDLEGLPLAMLEAMNEGIPVLASDIPAHRQLLGKDRGLLFHAGNVESCKDQLMWAIQHPAEMAQMSKRAKKHVQICYNWEHITDETLKVYSTLIGEVYGQQPTQAPVRSAMAVGSVGKSQA